MSKTGHRNVARGLLAGSAVLLAGAFTWSALAQQPARPAPGAATAALASQLRIRKTPKLGRSSLVRSPEFQSNVQRALSGSRKPREWGLFDVIFETAPEWMDEVTVTFYVMCEGRSPEGKKTYSFYSTSATYVDLERGEHVATALLRPQAILRYGEPGAFGVEFAIGGTIVAKETVADITGLGEEWWRDRRVMDSPLVVRRDGYLLERAKTPFALANIDDYETVK